MNTSKLELLECTLRDGSYAVDFQFSDEFTFQLASELDRLGFPLIEVGHGIGIGASSKVIRAAASDKGYASAANSAVKNGIWGMFAIPGIAEIHEVEKMFESGMGFVRVGIDSNAIDAGLEFLRSIIQPGKKAFVNFMKSYALSSGDFADKAKLALESGASGIYLVDSAGGMLPNQIKEYGKKLLELKRDGVKIGFHGHDNLGMANANSIELIQIGFNLIDCTLQGLGRSSGNTCTEQLVSLLARLKIDESYDIPSVLKVGEKLVRPRIPLAGTAGLDFYAGYNQFHSSFMENLLEVSRKIGVDPYDLMREHCKSNIESAKVPELTVSAHRLLESGREEFIQFPRDRYFGNGEA